MALREFLHTLETNGELHRTSVEIDPILETTEVSIRASREKLPALLIERPKGSRFPMVINHYSSIRRIELGLGRHPEEIGQELIEFVGNATVPTVRVLWENRPIVRRILKGFPRRVHAGISQEVVSDPDLNALPTQLCWPKDGGRFITYGEVFTYDPRDGKRNIGLYRLHVFDKRTTGMHWQIEKGGGFHYVQAEKTGRSLEVAVALGTSPALLLAAVAALPEGMDEAMFAGILQNKRIAFSRGKHISIDVPTSAEFILEGTVEPRGRQLEGPFGDHFGHYSVASEYPIFRVKAVTHRQDPIYPGIVVGKPPMEDKYLGDATQMILGPLVKLIHPEVESLWAYHEAGFHNLVVVAIEPRYEKEAMKTALGLLGTGQLSLTKCLITVSAGVNVRHFDDVLEAVRLNFDPHFDFIMVPKVPLDTLDFTSYTMQLGSKMIIDATRKPNNSAPFHSRDKIASENSSYLSLNPRLVDPRIIEFKLLAGALLLVKIASSLDTFHGPPQGRQVIEKLIAHHQFSRLKIIAAVSEDVNIHDEASYIWGIFSRFDCQRDLVFQETRLWGIAPIHEGVMGIDATWKPGYPEPLVMENEVVKRVDHKWRQIWKR